MVDGQVALMAEENPRIWWFVAGFLGETIIQGFLWEVVIKPTGEAYTQSVDGAVKRICLNAARDGYVDSDTVAAINLV